MIVIAKHQILTGLRDAKFLFLFTIILATFISNGLIFSNMYQRQLEDYRSSVAENNRLMQPSCANLQELAIFEQRMMQPPSESAFIATGGSRFLPNGVVLSALSRYEMIYQHRSNDEMPILPPLDWAFIIGSLFTLLTVLISYGAVSEERRDGTLRQVMANPLSRLNLFLGKYLGFLVILLVSLFIGVIFNLATIYFLGGPPLGGANAWRIVVAVVLGALTVSLFLLVSLAVSALTRTPAVSLVILLSFWVLAVIAVPGISRIVAEQMKQVTSQVDIDAEITQVRRDLYLNAPKGASDWNGDPFAANIPNRAELRKSSLGEPRKIRDRHWNDRIEQVLMSQRLATVSPSGLLSDAYQQLSSTGVYGLRRLIAGATEYRRNLYQYIVDRDADDNSTPHLVYGLRGRYDVGVFSSRPTPFESVPKYDTFWRDTSRSAQAASSLWHWALIIAMNLIAGFIALVAIQRVDPR